MTGLADTLPQDVEALQALSLAARAARAAEAERLRQIIKEMQCHRFGRRAETLPLYRQAQIYARQGIKLDRSTLADWTGRAAFLLRPVHQHLLASLRRSPKLFADETTAPVHDPGRGRTKTGQLWAYARDDRPGAGPIRRPSPTSTPPNARPSGRWRTWPVSAACCRWTATAAIFRQLMRRTLGQPSATHVQQLGAPA